MFDDGTASSFSLVYETPPHIELRETPSGRLLGYDRTERQFVLYEPVPSNTADALPSLSESRFDKKYDRVELTAASGLACAGTSCDLLPFYGDRIAPIPDEVGAVWASGRCAGGRGIMCLDEGSGTWSVQVSPAHFDLITSFVRLGTSDFVVTEANGMAWFVRDDAIEPVDVHEPLTTLVEVNDGNSVSWVARTASGKLVVGAFGGSRTCGDVEIDAVVAASYHAFARRGDTLIEVGAGSTCIEQTMPPGMTGVTSGTCGVGYAPFAFDAHRVFGMPYGCVSVP